MVTQKDIARETGFSVTAVATVLRGEAASVGIKAATAEKIRETAARLGYKKSTLALQMKSGNFNTVIQLLPDPGSEHIALSVLHAANAGADAGFTMREYFHRENLPEFEALLNKVIGLWPVAFFVWSDIGPRFEPLYLCAARYKIPVVSIDYDSPRSELSVLTDDRKGILEAVRHLTALGHRRIVHVTDTFDAQYALSRYEHYREALRNAGLELDDSLCFHEPFFSEPERLIRYAERIISMKKDRPTAITCGSDYAALKIVQLLQCGGLHVPGDISVVGYGGLPIAYTSMPVITTIAQPFARLGMTAVELLPNVLNRTVKDKIHRLDSVFQLGQTTGVCRK